MTFRSLLAPRFLGAGLALGLGLTAFAVQDPPPPPPPRPGAGPDRDEDRPPPPPPPDRLFNALDVDRDGRISAAEIRDAAGSLKKLDLDGDGFLSRDEIVPPRPDRPPGGGRRPEGPPPRDEEPVPTPAAATRAPDGSERIPLAFRGGHETDPRDRGRPVALVAGALGVAPEVFRDAFSKVKPAPAGTSPTPEHARENKAVLMAALGPLGISNDEIDRASNQYRYVRGRGEMWPTKAATGHAIVKDGVLVSVTIADGGSGYNAAPTVTIPGHPELVLEARVGFSRDLDRNGSILSVRSKTGLETR